MRTTTVHPLSVRAENDPASPARASGLLVPSACAASPLTRARFPGISLGADRRGDRFGRPPRSTRAHRRRANRPSPSRLRTSPLVPDICRFGVPRHPSPPPLPCRRPSDATPRRSTPRSSRPSARSRCSAATSPSRHPNPACSTLPYSPRRNTRRYPARRDHPRARALHPRGVRRAPVRCRRRRRFAQTAQTRRDVLVQSLRGVSVYRRTGRWEAHIWHDGKQRHLGTFGDAESAARAYDKGGDAFSRRRGDGRLELNFPRTEYDGDAELKGMLRADGEVFVRWLRASSKKRARDAA